MDQLYNSFDPAYKTPFGAVTTGQQVTFRLTIPYDYGFVRPHLVLIRDGGEPVHHAMAFDGCEEGVNRFSLALSLSRAGLYFYYFDLYSDFRKLFRGPMGQAVMGWTTGPWWQLTVYEAGFATPAPIKGGVLYQIFPDRFHEGKKHKPMPFSDRIYRENKHGEPYFWPNEEGGYLNMDYFGGDFAGIMEKLPYLKELGVSWIYLNPIFEAHSNHRYNTADYLKPDPLLGTKEEFRQLCAAARRQGIRIILDGVFSHTGSDSIYFNREGRYGPGGAYHDPKSPYRSWFDFSPNYACGYRSWWGFESLPEVQESDPAYREFICGKGGVIDTWLSLGASGFRLDVADELPDDFIEEIRKAVKAHGPDCYLLGEVWEDATTKEAYGVRRTYLLGKGLDAVMNYPFRNAVLGFLKGRSAADTAEDIMAICEHYPAPALHCLMNFMSTHDTERAGPGAALPDELHEHPRHRAGSHRHCRRTLGRQGPLLAERPHPASGPVRPRRASAAAGLRHDLHAARRAQHLLRRRDRHAGLPGPLQPGLFQLGIHREPGAPGAAPAGSPAPGVRRLRRGRHADHPGGGRRAALPPHRPHPDGGDHREPVVPSDLGRSLRQAHRGEPLRLHHPGGGCAPCPGPRAEKAIHGRAGSHPARPGGGKG